nr:MarR family transcriptional regulator [Xylophilus sp.]
NLKPLVDAGWVAVVPGVDARSRLVCTTAAGSAKRAEAQAHWRAAQESLNQTLGLERVVALHAMVDEVLHLLAQPPEEDTTNTDEVAHAN